MKSMTGYGRAQETGSGVKFTVELSSVNRRQNEIVVNLPKEYAALEIPVRDVVRQRVSRGRTSVLVTLESEPSAASGQLVLNTEQAKAYCAELSRLQTEMGLAGPISLEMVLGLPGIVQSRVPEVDTEMLWPLLEQTLLGALEAMVAMREREGCFLAKELQERLKVLRENVRTIVELAPKVKEHYRTALKERINNAQLDVSLDEERLCREVLLFAERSDISEELARLESHFSQFESLLKEKEQPVGRTLEFLVQELLRELNTLSAKASDSEISQLVVSCKTEVEKIREQVQNIE